jgi:hypothetical protein
MYNLLFVLRAAIDRMHTPVLHNAVESPGMDGDWHIFPTFLVYRLNTCYIVFLTIARKEKVRETRDSIPAK